MKIDLVYGSKYKEEKGEMYYVVCCIFYLLSKALGNLNTKAECDFLVRDGIDITGAIQVCHAFGDKETRDRELKGLKEALVTYHLDSGWILTDDTEETLEQNGKMIKIMPVWKWMMNK